MRAPKLPVVRSFTIPRIDIRFVDIRTLRGDKRELALNKYILNAREMASDGEVDIDVELCGSGFKKLDVAIEKFLTIQRGLKSYTWEDFEADGGTVVDETCPKPWLSSLVLAAVNSAGDPIGCISLTNIVVRKRLARGIVVSAAPGPGLPPIGTRSRESVCGIVMAFILSERLTMKDGSLFRVDEFEMPSSEEFRWSTATNRRLSDLFVEVEKEGDRHNSKRDEKSPLRFKRKRRNRERM